MGPTIMCSQLAITLRSVYTSPRTSVSHQWARKRTWNLITWSGLQVWLVQIIIYTKISTCLRFPQRGRTRDPSRRLLVVEEAGIRLSISSSHHLQGSILNSLLATSCPALSWTRMLLRIKIMEFPDWIILVASLMWDPLRTINTISCPTTLRGLGNLTTSMRWGIKRAKAASGVHKNRKGALLAGMDLKSIGKWRMVVLRSEGRARVTRKIC